jgi:hypothetical protein
VEDGVLFSLVKLYLELNLKVVVNFLPVGQEESKIREVL